MSEYISEDQFCEVHKMSVPARLGKDGKDYWLCPYGHFLKHPNSWMEDKLPEDEYYDKEDNKEKS